MKYLYQELNCKDDSFTYTVYGEKEPSYRVDSNANLIDLKQGKTIGKYKLMHDQWHLYIDDVLIDSSGVNTLFYLPEFELKTLTSLVNK
jgi:hypothetical protein